MAILVREEGKQNGHISESLDVPLWTVILSLLRRFSVSTVHRLCPASSGLFMPSLLHASYSLLTGLQDPAFGSHTYLSNPNFLHSKPVIPTATRYPLQSVPEAPTIQQVQKQP